MITVRPGESYAAYRVESREACTARGGTWKCGNFGPQSIEGYTGSPVCPTNAGTAEPVFKGVGTTCSNPGIASVTATVQAQDYLTQRRAANTGANGRLQYEDASVGLVGSFYNGTVSLSPAASNQWEYTFPAQRSGTCVGSVRLVPDGSGWQIQFTYSVVSWVLYPYATAGSEPGSQYNYVVDPSDQGFATYMLPGSSQTYRVPRYKELADMQCQASGIWSNSVWDPNAGYGRSTGPTRTQIWSATSCELFGTTTWSKTFQPVFPPSTTVLRQEGTNSLTLSLAASSNPLP